MSSDSNNNSGPDSGPDSGPGFGPGFGLPFVHLHVHSAYSLSQGALKIPDLIGLCQEHGMPAVAVTDTNNLFGAMEFALKAKAGGVQPIIGCQIDLTMAEENGYGSHGQKAQSKPLVLLAQSEVGYGNLLKLISKAYLDGDSQESVRVDLEQLATHSADVICLTGGPLGPVNHLLSRNQDKEAAALIERLNQIYAGRLYIELQRHGWAEEDKVEPSLLKLAFEKNIPLVATNDCYFATEDMYEAHDALITNAQGTTVSDKKRWRVTDQHYFKSAEEMVALFKDIPEAVRNTIQIARRCAFMPEERAPILPAYESEAGRTEEEELAVQARDGLEERLVAHVYQPQMSEEERTQAAKPYQDRLVHELQTINQMGFPGYFLIVADFMQWSVEQGIPVGPGRGSGAGSVVAWALKITNLDPLRWGLLFERFLNPERVSMPDFDIDFCQERRDEVIDYVAQKYGHDKVAQIITFGKLQARAVLRDVGRVFEMPYGQVDRICKMVPNNPANPVTLAEAIESEEDLQNLRDEDESVARLLDTGLKLEGLYRHASTHAAGVVIGDRPLDELIPLYRDPRSEMPVTQFDMKMVEKAGLVKFDFLGLKTLTVLQQTVALLKHRGVEIDLDQIDLYDAKTYEMLAQGDTTAVFQLESSGMRDVLRKLVPDRFEDIIAVVALYRPGPMDNIPAFIECKHGRKDPDYLHPSIKSILKETHGIMIYQEQVMQIAQTLAGYSLGQADLLRRAMGKKIKSEMDAQRKNFVDGAQANGVEAKTAEHIFEQVAKFAGYGFNKSHAAAYALVAYQTAYLKANYPVEFMAATMTLDMGNTDKLSIFHQELARLEIPLLPPSLNRSQVLFSVEETTDGVSAIRYALAALKGAGQAAMTALVSERTTNGPFKDGQDLATRLEARVLNKKQLECLASAGAFDDLHPNRAAVFAAVEPMLAIAQSTEAERNSQQDNLFAGAQDALPANTLDWPGVEDWVPREKLAREFDAVGFYLSAHPLDAYQPVMESLGITPAMQIPDQVLEHNKFSLNVAGVVTNMRQRTSARGNRYAFVTLSDASGPFEVTAFSEVLMASKELLTGHEPLLIKAEPQLTDDGGYRLTAQSVEVLETKASHLSDTVRVPIADEKTLEQVTTTLASLPKGRARVEFQLQAAGHDVILRSSQTYRLTPEARALLQASA